MTHGLKALTAISEPVSIPSDSQLSAATGSPDSTDGVQTQPLPLESREASEEVTLLAGILPTAPIDVAAEENPALQSDTHYAVALADDPIRRARQLISAFRVTSLRREVFEAAVVEAKSRGLLPQDLPSSTQLLRDVDTWWSSVLLMIDRVLELNPV